MTLADSFLAALGLVAVLVTIWTLMVERPDDVVESTRLSGQTSHSESVEIGTRAA